MSGDILSPSDADRHGEAGRRPWINLEDAWLAPEVTLEPLGIVNAMPRLDADEISARLSPDSKVWRVWERHLQSRTRATAIAKAAAQKRIKYDGVIDEEIVAQREGPAYHWSVEQIRLQQTLVIDAADRSGLVVLKFKPCAQPGVRRRAGASAGPDENRNWRAEPRRLNCAPQQGGSALHLCR